MEDRIVRIVHATTSRRAFLMGSLGAIAATAIASEFAFSEGRALAVTFTSDIDILNFALTLEHLENRAYRDAVNSGKLTGANLNYARTFGQQENEHVQLLTAAISQASGTPVREQAKYNFPAFTDEATIITFLRTLEEVGVGAYTGASPFVRDPNILATAGGILQVEARHTAILRRQNGMTPAPGPTDITLTPDQTLARATPILGS